MTETAISLSTKGHFRILKSGHFNFLLTRVNRQFATTRPNRLWVADLTFVATWSGFAYVAFVVAAFARRIVGWQVTSHLREKVTTTTGSALFLHVIIWGGWGKVDGGFSLKKGGWRTLGCVRGG